MNVHGKMPSEEEMMTYCDRINNILAKGGQISTIQLYTISRPPAESYVTALTGDQINQIAQTLQENINVPIEIY